MSIKFVGKPWPYKTKMEWLKGEGIDFAYRLEDPNTGDRFYLLAGFQDFNPSAVNKDFTVTQVPIESVHRWFWDELERQFYDLGTPSDPY